MILHGLPRLAIFETHQAQYNSLWDVYPQNCIKCPRHGFSSSTFHYIRFPSFHQDVLWKGSEANKHLRVPQ